LPRGQAPGLGANEAEWYTLREVAAALGISRQAVHARVRKDQLEAERVDGTWRVASGVVAAAVQAERNKALSLGSVRLLPAAAQRPADEAYDLARRVAEVEATLAELSESHRRQLDVREQEVAVLRGQRARLTAALHAMVDILGVDAGSQDERPSESPSSVTGAAD